MSPGRRSFSLPRSAGTMQNVQVLLQPTEMDDPGGVGATRAGSAASTGTTSSDSGDLDLRLLLRRGRARAGAGSEPMLWVPKTTSTHGASPDDLAAVLLRQAAADGDLHAGAARP